MISHGLRAQIYRPIFSSLLPAGLGISNMNFLIADILFLSEIQIQLSHEGMQQKSNLSSSPSLAPKLHLHLPKVIETLWS